MATEAADPLGRLDGIYVRSKLQAALRDLDAGHGYPHHEQSLDLIMAEVHGTETVLLVEDDDAVREVATRTLSRFGYTVLSAEEGARALEIVEDQGEEIDLLLTDIMMPGMNGVELGLEVARRKPGIKVFYMSGYADQELVRQGLLEPGTTFLQKPFTPRQLVARIRAILDGSGGDGDSSHAWSL